MAKSGEELSKFLSYVLRHAPESIGLSLDIDGWGRIDELIAGAVNKGFLLESSEVLSVTSLSGKRRFEVSEDGLRIRALQGHSTKSVSRSYLELEPPEFLYHGTAKRFLDSIRQNGLDSGERHYVHLTLDSVTAMEVGSRYGVAVLLKIDSRSMFAEGYRFFKSENEVWLTSDVPSKFIEEI